MYTRYKQHQEDIIYLQVRSIFTHVQKQINVYGMGLQGCPEHLCSAVKRH